MSKSLAEQLAPLCPAHAPSTRQERQREAIEAVPIIRTHTRTLRRFWLDVGPRKTSRERTTFRRVKAATPALITRDFPTYNEALSYSRSIGGHKPMRMEFGAYWRIVSPNTSPTVAEWVNVGPWSPPLKWSYCNPESIAEILDALPDFSEG